MTWLGWTGKEDQPCAGGWPTRAPASCWRSCSTSPPTPLSTRACTPGWGATTTNGDGFGVGWYVDDPPPGVFRAVGPAWSDRNLRELAGYVASPLFLAYIRASTGMAVQQTNCHPFRHGRCL